LRGITGPIAIADVGLRRRLKQSAASNIVERGPVCIRWPIGVSGKNFAVSGTFEGVVYEASSQVVCVLEKPWQRLGG
jgi:hypothetical protein